MSDSIADIVNGVVDGSLSDELVIDWLRDIFENGLDENSTIFLTKGCLTTSLALKIVKPISSILSKTFIALESPDSTFLGKSICVVSPLITA